MNIPDGQRVTIASTAGDADRVAQILDSGGIAYEERLDAGDEESSRVCYLGTAFFVAPAELERARALLKTNGIAIE